MKNFNRLQKDRLDALEARLIAKRELYYNGRKPVLSDKCPNCQQSKDIQSSKVGGNVSMQKAYKLELPKHSKVAQSKGSHNSYAWCYDG